MTTLRDKFGRYVKYLRISVTDWCNLRCQYCMPEEGLPQVPHDAIVTYEEIIRLVDLFAKAGITKVRIIGGEPLVRKNVVDCIGRLSKISGIKELCMTTNGVLLKSLAGPLKKAGLKRINISLDTLNADKFQHITKRDNFRHVWGGVEESLVAGLAPVKINVVIMKGVNDNEVVDFLLLTKRLPLSVRFIEYMPVGSGQWNHALVVPASRIKEAIESELGTLVPFAARIHQGPAVYYRARRGRGKIGFISPVSNHFCKTCNRVRLTADGHLRSCLLSCQPPIFRTTQK